MIKLVVFSALLAFGIALPKRGSISSVRNVHPQIVGGGEAEPHSVPWQAWIRITFDHGEMHALKRCSGALISSKYVLTPWYLFEDMNEPSANVTLGAHNITAHEDTQITVRAKRMLTNETFRLGLLELETEIAESDAIKYGVLSKDVNNTFEGKTGKVCGWGAIMGPPDTSDVLKCEEGDIVSTEECRNIYGHVDDHSVCLSGDDGVPCYSDDGAPLSVDGKIIGIFTGLCYPEHPSPFDSTTTSEFLQWIQDNFGIVV